MKKNVLYLSSISPYENWAETINTEMKQHPYQYNTDHLPFNSVQGQASIGNFITEKFTKVKAIQCSRCILDVNDDPAILFDEKGVCNYCHNYDEAYAALIKTGVEGETLLRKKVEEIKQWGKGKKYDCLIGLSGGIDSSYVAYLAKQTGLRALCMHFDNGWNSELAVRNIHNLVQKLDYDLLTYVIDWEEFKDLQLAYLKASVIDIEVITDHAISTVINRTALQHNLKYILDGDNVVTEAVLPPNWAWKIKDYINIKAIHKKFGQKKLKSFPFQTRKERKVIEKAGMESVCFLNWLPYVKDDAKKLLQEEIDWVDYGAKHHENLWTRFFQVYILPKKFNVDKRKAHLSNLICSGQLTRAEALLEIDKPCYDEQLLEQDKNFVLKKFGLSEEEFTKIMNAPVRSHREFDYEGSLFNYYPVLKPFRVFWEMYKSIARK